jgi:hypothetical protein
MHPFSFPRDWLHTLSQESTQRPRWWRRRCPGDELGSVGGRGVVGVGALVFAHLAWWVSRKQLRLVPGTKRPCALRDSGFFQSGGIPPSAQYSTTTPRATGGYRLQSSEQRQECSSQRSLRIPLRGTALIVPDNSYHGVNADFFGQHMGPKDTEAAHQVNVSVRTHGPTKAQYRCIYVMR